MCLVKYIITLLEEAALLEALREGPLSSRRVEIHSREFSPGSQVCNDRSPLRDAVEVVDLELYSRLACNGQEVQYAVRRAARGHDSRYRVLYATSG